jgi:hypothetical protein
LAKLVVFEPLHHGAGRNVNDAGLPEWSPTPTQLIAALNVRCQTPLARCVLFRLVFVIPIFLSDLFSFS